ncbi:dTDP-4-dehydrorhamnose reductase [Synechococcus elongatus IITB4]|uniref:dTDP-4-dehydrorhamnose reductase n=1 Tax=Synechococcus elongatus TaxID=32046 RepID=UPI0030CAD4C8
MKVLLTGAAGQVGQALQRLRPNAIDLIDCDREQLDLSDESALRTAIQQTCPDWVINAGAYTAVDRSESEPDLALAINAHAVQVLAEELAKTSGNLLHISTDFVFAGDRNRPYPPEANRQPLSVYGATKAAGEEAIAQLLPTRSLIVRTAWVYGLGGRNFVTTMLRLMAERDRLTVVWDQIGTPTWTDSLAAALWQAIAQNLTGIHHCTDAGVASWYDFAVAIQDLALERGLLQQAIPIAAIPSSAYPTPATRPAYSVLDCADFNRAIGRDPLHWRHALAQMLTQLATN